MPRRFTPRNDVVPIDSQYVIARRPDEGVADVAIRFPYIRCYKIIVGGEAPPAQTPSPLGKVAERSEVG